MNMKTLKFKLLLSTAIIAIVLVGISLYGKQETEKQLNKLLREYQLTETVTYDSVFFNPLTFSPDIYEVIVQSEKPIRFEKLTLNKYQLDMDEGVINVDVSYQTSEMSLVDAPKEIKKLLFESAMYGLETFESSGNISVFLADGDLQASIHTEVDEFADLAIVFKGEYKKSEIDEAISSISKNGIFALLTLNQSLTSAIYLSEFDIELNTDKYLNKTIEYKKEKEDFDKKDFVLGLHEGMQKTGIAEANSPELAEIEEELLDFIDSPSQIHFSISPDEPVSFFDYSKYFKTQNAYKNLNMEIVSG